MYRKLIWIFLILLVCLAGFASAGLSSSELPEWTVMVYLCGADLESEHGMASYNLREISELWFPEQVVKDAEGGVEIADWSVSQINVLVETGGAKAWHGMDQDEYGESLGVDIASDRLQRYRFDLSCHEEEYGYMPTLQLLEDQPLSNMAAPETLSDFIRWGKREYPAKKYALVLWGHGGGSATGLIVDELYNDDIMYLYELEQALWEADTQFEIVALDACLMCSLETAQILSPFADYMVASEELSSGYGSAFGGWMYDLYRHPECDGGQVGSWFCDATQQKYADSGDALAEMRLTYTVVELSCIDQVARAFDRLFDYAGRLYQSIPDRFNMFLNQLTFSESYGTDNEDMLDLSSFLFNPLTIELIDSKYRDDLVDALEDAIYYSVRGSGRVASRGLSFCFSPDMTSAEMDIYAKNCKCPHYLALLDALNPEWSAPEWVYESAKALPQIEDMEDYHMTLELIHGDGLPRLHVINRDSSMMECNWCLYAFNEMTGEISLLGENAVLAEWDDTIGDLCYTIDPRGRWPAIEDALCCVELIDMKDGIYLYNIPLRFETETANLRIRGTSDEAVESTALKYEALGLWQGYNQDIRMPNRSMIGLPQRQGWDYTLLYPLCDMRGNETGGNLQSAPLTMYRSIDIREIPLPQGTYYFRYVVTDLCHRTHKTDMTRLYWDGTSFSVISRTA